MRFPIDLPPGQELFIYRTTALALSPDGRRLAYVVGAVGSGGLDRKLYIRNLDQLEPMPLPGTEVVLTKAAK